MEPAGRQKKNFSPLRVLYFDHTASLGGGEIALLNLIACLDRTEVSPVVVLGMAGPLGEKLQSQCETYVLPLPVTIKDTKKGTLGLASLFRIREIAGVFRYVWQLARFIRQHDVELVHTNSLKADLIGGIAGRLSGRPVIWHVRDRIEDDYLPRPVVRIFRLLCRIAPTYVIANSAATMRTIYPGAYSPDEPFRMAEKKRKMCVVHDGTVVPPDEEIRIRTGEIERIGLIGRISPWKGQHVFLQAAAQVSKTFPNARFVIVGAALFDENEYEVEIRQLPGKLGIENVVEFTGFRGDIGTVIQGLDLIVHASTTGEPFGQVIIEGMAAGKPVVATDGGGVPEIVEDGKTGKLVPMGDADALAKAICELLADPERAREMGIQGRQRAKDHFRIELTARGVEAVYRRVVGREKAEK